MAKHNLWCECNDCMNADYGVDYREPVGDDKASLMYNDNEW